MHDSESFKGFTAESGNQRIQFTEDRQIGVTTPGTLELARRYFQMTETRSNAICNPFVIDERFPRQKSKAPKRQIVKIIGGKNVRPFEQKEKSLVHMKKKSAAEKPLSLDKDPISTNGDNNTATSKSPQSPKGFKQIIAISESAFIRFDSRSSKAKPEISTATKYIEHNLQSSQSPDKNMSIVHKRRFRQKPGVNLNTKCNLAIEKNYSYYEDYENFRPSNIMTKKVKQIRDASKPNILTFSSTRKTCVFELYENEQAHIRFFNRCPDKLHPATMDNDCDTDEEEQQAALSKCLTQLKEAIYGKIEQNSRGSRLDCIRKKSVGIIRARGHSNIVESRTPTMWPSPRRANLHIVNSPIPEYGTSNRRNVSVVSNVFRSKNKINFL
jgi:hypothetical protein